MLKEFDSESSEKEIYTELILSIKNNLVRGDLLKVANESKYSPYDFTKVLTQKTKNIEILELLYKKALENKSNILLMQNTLEGSNNEGFLREKTNVLIQIIRSYLDPDEINKVLKDNGLNRDGWEMIIRHKNFNIIYFIPLYEKALENKSALNEICAMISKFENTIDPNTILIRNIKNHLKFGDIPALAKKHNLKNEDLYNVTKGNSSKQRIIKILYEKALDNRNEIAKKIESLK